MKDYVGEITIFKKKNYYYLEINIVNIFKNKFQIK